MSETIYQDSGDCVIRKTVTDAGWKVEVFRKVQDCQDVAEAVRVARGESATPSLESSAEVVAAEAPEAQATETQE